MENAIEVRDSEDGAEDMVVEHAMRILQKRLRKTPVSYLHSPLDAKRLLVLQLAQLEREHFVVMFLDANYGVLDMETMFKGTVTQASVYPREVVKRALQLNASAVVLSHNHPSGNTAPSDADIHLTQALKDALKYIDVRVLDHIIVGGMQTFSFAENGLVL